MRRRADSRHGRIRLKPTLVALVLAILLAPLPVAGAQDAQPEARIVVTFDNQGERVDGFVRIERERGGIVHDDTFSVPAGGRADIAVADAAGAPHIVDVDIGRARFALHIDTSGCASTFVAAFRHADGFLSDAPGATGCATLPAAAEALREEARAASRAAAPERPLGVPLPLPHDGDVGRYSLWYRDEPTTWADAASFEFRASAAPVIDAWGRAWDGARFDRIASGASTCAAGVVTSRGPAVGTAADTTGAIESASFAPGRIAPVSEALSGCSAMMLAGTLSGAQLRSSEQTTLRHDVHTVVACLFRHGWQGDMVAEGARLRADDACAAWSQQGVWVAGRVAREDGLDILPLYLDEPNLVARVKVAAGIAYPIEVEWWGASDGPLRHRAFRLDALSQGKTILHLDEPAPAADAPAPRTVDIDALRGPAHDAPAMVFPLRSAADAALADPTLTRLRALVATGAAFLGAAEMRSTAQSAGPGVVDSWYLLFAAEAVEPVTITCHRARDTAALPLAMPTCSERDPPPSVGLAAPPAAARASDVPQRGVGYAEALVRWRTHAPDAARDAPTYASYAPLGRDGGPPSLGVGLTYPEGTPVDTTTEARLDHVTLRLDGGITLARVAGATRAVGVGDAPGGLVAAAGLASATPAPANAPAVPAPLAGAAAVVLGAAAVALLAWLALKTGLVAMFTRLVRPRVLDQELRASIHDLVHARPGAHAAEVAQHLERAQNVVDHHLDVLVREGFLTCLQTPGFRRYFVTGRFSPAEMRAFAALREGQAEKLYRIIEANPGIHMGELAERAGVSTGYASKQVRRLADAGLVDSVRVGKAVRVHALER